MQSKKYAVLIGRTIELNESFIEIIQNASLIVVLDSAINYFMEHPNLTIRPHVLLGDFDYNLDFPRIRLQFPELQIKHTPDQNATDFEKGIEYLIELGFKKIIGFGLTGKRMDHTFNNISSLGKYNDNAEILIMDENSIIECISRSYNKHLSKDTVISLLPLGTVTGIITKNLKYPLMNETLSLGIRSGSSNTVNEDGEVIITIGKGKLIVMQCWD